MTATFQTEGDVYGFVRDNAGTIHQNFYYQSAAGQPRIPIQLPPPVEHFMGREAEVEAVLQHLYPGQTVTLWGPGGMGKTAVAATTLHQLIHNKTLLTRFPDGVIFYSFYGRPTTESILDHIIRTYDESATEISPAAAFRCLAGKKLLLVLDGAEEAIDLNAVLSLRGQCGLFITTRDRSHTVGQRLELIPLPGDAASDLINAWLDAPLDAPLAEAFSQLAGRLPLALRLVGRYLDQTGEPPGDYLAALQATPLAELSHGPHREESVAILLERSVAQLSPTTQAALAVLGRLAYLPVTPEPIAAALNLPLAQLRPVLAELFRYGLLLRGEAQSQLSHALIHTYARRRLNLSAEQLVNLATYFDKLARIESKNGLVGYEKLHPLRPHMMQVHAACAQENQWEAVCSLTWAIEDYLDVQGFSTERLTILNAGLAAAQHLDNRRDEEAFLINLGLASSASGQVTEAIAYYQQALPICRELGHQKDEAAALGNLGLAYRDLGQVEQSIDHHQQALLIDREIGYRQGEASALGNLGNAYSDLGQVEQAIDHYQQALVIDREIGYQYGIAVNAGHLGVAWGGQGKFEQARNSLQESLQIFKAIQSPYAAWAQHQLDNLS